MTKRYVLYKLIAVLILIVTNSLFSQENFYRVKKTNYYSGFGYVYPVNKDDTLVMNFYDSPGDSLPATTSNLPLDTKDPPGFKKNPPFSGFVYISYEDLIIPGSDSIDPDFLEEKNYIYENFGNGHAEHWIPNFYFKPIIENDINKLKDYKKEIQNVDFYKIETFILNPMFLDLNFGSGFYFINIKKYSQNLYRVVTIPITESISEYKITPTTLMAPFENKKPVFLYFYRNKSKIRVYIEGYQEPLWDLMLVDDQYLDIINKFYERGGWTYKFPYTKYLEPDILEEWPTQTLDEIKKYFYKEKPDTPSTTLDKPVPLYSIPFKYDDLQIKTIPADTPVYILESGSHAVLNDIVAPWVHVELEDGTRGWCWAGFLKDWTPEAAKKRIEDEKQQAKVIEEARIVAEKEQQRLEADANKNRLVLIVSVVGGVLLLGGIILFVIKKKN